MNDLASLAPSHELDTVTWSHLDALEAESMHILREVAAECRNPAILFSGGKDSLVVVHLARKALHPEPLGIPLLHIDTEHNFPEVIAFRDRIVREWHLKLYVRSVGDSIRSGRVRHRTEDARVETRCKAAPRFPEGRLAYAKYRYRHGERFVRADRREAYDALQSCLNGGRCCAGRRYWSHTTCERVTSGAIAAGCAR